jgi:hypothetical protein
MVHDPARRDLLVRAFLVAAAASARRAAWAQDGADDAGPPEENPMSHEVALDPGGPVVLPAEEVPAAEIEPAEVEGSGRYQEGAWFVKFVLNPIEALKISQLGPTVLKLELPARPTTIDGPGDYSDLALKATTKLWSERWTPRAGQVDLELKSTVAAKWGGKIAGDVEALLRFDPVGRWSFYTSFRLGAKWKPGSPVQFDVAAWTLGAQVAF